MPEKTSLNWFRVIIQSSAIALALVLLPFFAFFVAAAITILPFTNTFFAQANITPQKLLARAKAGWRQSPPLFEGKYTLLLLGTDELPNRPEMPIMTDTIMLVSLDLKQGRVNTVAIPRDLWSSQYQTKINSLYEYGRQRDPQHPNDLLLSELAELVAVPIQSVLTINPSTLALLIDALQGVEIDVPVSFTDTQFPRDDVDIRTERDPQKLYETVHFDSGKHMLTGKQALQYMRSRHGNNSQNTDIARSERQTIVMRAIAAQLIDQTTLKNPDLLAKLWNFYQAEYEQSLSFETLVSLVSYRINVIGWQGSIRKTITALRSFTVTQANIPITHYNQATKKDELGLLYNPKQNKMLYQGQWVYVATNSALLKNYLQEKLGYD